jgi:hypothetical protein
MDRLVEFEGYVRVLRATYVKRRKFIEMLDQEDWK